MAEMRVSFRIWSVFEEAWSQYHKKELWGKFVWHRWYSTSYLLPCLGLANCKYRRKTGQTTFIWPGLCWYSLFCPSRLEREFEKQELGKEIQVADSKWQQGALISGHWVQLDLNPLNQQHGRLKKRRHESAKEKWCLMAYAWVSVTILRGACVRWPYFSISVSQSPYRRVIQDLIMQWVWCRCLRDWIHERKCNNTSTQQNKQKLSKMGPKHGQSQGVWSGPTQVTVRQGSN